MARQWNDPIVPVTWWTSLRNVEMRSATGSLESRWSAQIARRPQMFRCAWLGIGQLPELSRELVDGHGRWLQFRYNWRLPDNAMLQVVGDRQLVVLQRSFSQAFDDWSDFHTYTVHGTVVCPMVVTELVDVVALRVQAAVSRIGGSPCGSSPSRSSEYG